MHPGSGSSHCAGGGSKEGPQGPQLSGKDLLCPKCSPLTVG